MGKTICISGQHKNRPLKSKYVKRIAKLSFKNQAAKFRHFLKSEEGNSQFALEFWE